MSTKEVKTKNVESNETKLSRIINKIIAESLTPNPTLKRVILTALLNITDAHMNENVKYRLISEDYLKEVFENDLTSIYTNDFGNYLAKLSSCLLSYIVDEYKNTSETILHDNWFSEYTKIVKYFMMMMKLKLMKGEIKGSDIYFILMTIITGPNLMSMKVDIDSTLEQK